MGLERQRKGQAPKGEGQGKRKGPESCQRRRQEQQRLRHSWNWNRQLRGPSPCSSGGPDEPRLRGYSGRIPAPTNIPPGPEESQPVPPVPSDWALEPGLPQRRRAPSLPSTRPNSPGPGQGRGNNGPSANMFFMTESGPDTADAQGMFWSQELGPGNQVFATFVDEQLPEAVNLAI